ncbi:DUF222 domain-containing protein [Pseudactinotalea sp.]|uniref:HNH endonuclease signature motif containing protein n=1 Tax=Pseudactinotalea sp. TaxID=1926260 RepID=UPI003B3AA548
MLDPKGSHEASQGCDASSAWVPGPGSGWSVAELEALVQNGVPLVRVDAASGMAEGEEELAQERLQAAGSWIDDLLRPEHGPVSWLAGRAPSGTLLSDLESLPVELVGSDYDSVELVALWAKLESYCAAGKRFAAAAMGRRESLANGLAHLAAMGIEAGEVSIAADELSVRLGISKPAAGRLVRSGRAMNETGMPTGDALAAGAIDAVKADLILDAVTDLGAGEALAVQERVLSRAPFMATGRLRREVAAAVAAVEPDRFEERCADAARLRRVGRPRVLADGMASLYAVLPAVEAAGVYRAVDAAARSAKAGGDDRTMDQLRADALAAMGSAAIQTGWIGPAPTPQEPSPSAGVADAHAPGGHRVADEGEDHDGGRAAGAGRKREDSDRGVPGGVGVASDSPGEAPATGSEPDRAVAAGDDPAPAGGPGAGGEPGCGDVVRMRVGQIGGASAHVRVVVPYTILMDDPPPHAPPEAALANLAHAGDVHASDRSHRRRRGDLYPHGHHPDGADHPECSCPEHVNDPTGCCPDGAGHPECVDSIERAGGIPGVRVGGDAGEAARAEDPSRTTEIHDADEVARAGDTDGAERFGNPGVVVEREGVPVWQVSVPDQLWVAFLDGYGPIPASAARALAAGSVWSRLVMDPVDRTVLELSSPKYRPPESMARLVRAAQPTCAGVTCSVDADSCDLHHRIPYPAGATSVWNLDPGCRRDHLLVTHGAWRYEEDGRSRARRWTTATGHVYEQQVDGTVTLATRQLPPGYAPDDTTPPPF